MRIVLAILIGIHGIIHLFGFLRAFGLSEFNAISQPIPKLLGMIWLLTFLLFVTALILMLSYHNYWWIIGILAVLLSQVLILIYWKDAKFGTILNLVILAYATVNYSAYCFEKKVDTEIIQMLAEEDIHCNEKSIISEQMVLDLPQVVQKWLSNSGIIGKENIKTVFIEQDLKMLMKPEQKEWCQAKAKQYFTTSSPAFNWRVYLKMFSLMSLVGRDKFELGKGEMTIKLFSLIPLVKVRNNKEINKATLQRYLAEIVWFPSAALSPYITWYPIDNNSAKATLQFNGTKGSGVFHFDENGTFKKFVAMRYKDVKDIEPTKWTVTATKTEMRNGITIPVEAKLDWEIDGDDWTWLNLRITNIAYNIK
ncbi:MAG: hypothetical protein PHD06_08540 [Bacteroidales bacterium]|jgi:hypothetical protein|nr:hypothetical protein [Bacteroidales bacterium]MDD4385210.1 hypothetical protein [Bacteroidales bacterium]MDY0198214.1 hypothetical protein [Tenuifilaceae bacterium]